MSASHTKGPWTLTHRGGSNFAVQTFEIRGMFGDTPNAYPVFNKSQSAIDGGFIHVSPQDARLIAAAPELLEAADEAFDFLGGIDGASEIRSTLLAAISKATSRQPEGEGA